MPHTDDDLWLTEALETDPRVMAELGGPRPIEDILGIHRRRLEHIANGAWYFKVVHEPGGEVVGAITIWQSNWRGEPISEAGWMIFPQHQGRGYASAALRLILERSRSEGRWGDVHAFPGATNVPSNALCRTAGFEQLETAEVDFAGRPLRVNHWVLRA